MARNEGFCDIIKTPWRRSRTTPSHNPTPQISKWCQYLDRFQITITLFLISNLIIMAPLNLTPLSSLRISKHFIPPYKLIPNTSQKPLLIYHACIQPSSTPSNIESHLSSTGVVTPQWRYSMYPTTHFHSTTHEVLCISRGAAKLCKSAQNWHQYSVIHKHLYTQTKRTVSWK